MCVWGGGGGVRKMVRSQHIYLFCKYFSVKIIARKIAGWTKATVGAQSIAR
jgi:hypothetical protein